MIRTATLLLALSLTACAQTPTTPKSTFTEGGTAVDTVHGSQAASFAPLSADALADALAQLLDTHDTSQRTNVTLVIRDLETGETLFDRGGGKLLIPASNLKIYTAAAAIDLLGPEHTWTTALKAVALDALDDRPPPTTVYLEVTGDPMFDTAQLEALVASFVENVTLPGPIVNVSLNTPRPWASIPLKGPGWLWDDDPDYYNMSIRGGMLNFNVADVRVSPEGERPGRPPSQTISEHVVGDDWPRRVLVENVIPSDYPAHSFGELAEATVNGWVGPKAGSDITVTRLPFTDDWQVRGNMKPDDAPVVVERLGVHDPAKWIASVLAKMLEGHGLEMAINPDMISVFSESTRGQRAGDFAAEREASGQVQQQGKPLSEAVQHFLRVSENAVGEMLLLTLSERFASDGQISWPAGAKVISDWLVNVAGVTQGSFRLVDGSGLSRYNLISANSSIQLLDFMDDHKHFGVFFAGLPTYEVALPKDGSWNHIPLPEFDDQRVFAKPGGMGGVSTISGYIDTLDGRRLAFSLLANGYVSSNESVRDLRDQVWATLVRYRAD